MQTLEVGRSSRVVVEIPDHIQAAAAGAPGGMRTSEAAPPADLAPKAADAALADALATAGFDLVADVALWPADAAAGMRATPGEAPASVRVDVGPSESAVILVEGQGGTFGWLRPDGADDGALRRASGGAVNFTLAPGDAPARRGSLLGWLADVLTRPVRVRVLKFIVRLTIDAAVDRIEGGNATGLVAVTDKIPERWCPSPRAMLPAEPEGRPARVLLLVHGTFSSTAGSFGQLVTHKDGEAFLDAALAHYDAVLGFDHKTLAEKVETNAEALADALAGLPQGTQVDAVAFSRGGLVFRVLAEELFPVRRPDVRFGKVVFVGCTNAGTHLAEPDNWDALADLYTNAIMAAARVVTGLIGVALDPLVSLAIKTLGEFVQYLAQVGVSERRVPGLASMEPDGETVRRLNAATDALPAAPAYSAVTSNFAPRFEPSRGLSREVVQLLLDKVTDDLWQGAHNDLVVDTQSMTNFGQRAGFLVPGGTFDFGDGEVVYHTVYFAAAKTCQRLMLGLDLPPPEVTFALEMETLPDLAAATEVLAPLEVDRIAAPSDDGALLMEGPGASGRFGRVFTDAVRHRSRFSLDTDDRGFRGFRGDRAPDVPDIVIAEPDPVHAAPPAASPAAPEPAVEPPLSCHVAASMPEAPPLGAPAELEVTISREAITVPAGTAHAAGIISVKPERKLRVQVVAKTNCTITGPSEEEIDPPAVGAPAALVFQVRGKAAGPAEIWVNVFQGALRLTRLVIQPRFAADGVIALAAPLLSDDPDPPLVDLRIYEENLLGGWRLRFLARCDDLPGDLAFNLDYVGPEIRIDKTQHVKDLFKQLEQSWADTDGQYESVMRRVRAAGADLFRSLFPKELQQVLWENRERIGSIQVFSSEPSIPWEVAYLVKPGETIPFAGAPASGGAFLAEIGLTRWSANVNIAPVRLRLRPGKARYCAPDYADPAYQLKHVPAEVEMLRTLLGATAVDGHRDPVLEVLARGEGMDYDVLHFACHGSGDPERVWNAGLLLGGFLRNNRVAREELSVAEVASYANLASGGARPIVFLNACQSGVGGYALSGTGGLAQAFVQRGAGLFVGSLWSIGDRPALTFSRTFYEALKAGRTVSQAGRQAREAAKAEKDATWLAYTVYGHPYARVTA